MTSETKRDDETQTEFTVRLIRAEAWDKGMRCGTSRAMRHMSDEPHLPLASEADNPYRKQPAALSPAASSADGGEG